MNDLKVRCEVCNIGIDCSFLCSDCLYPMYFNELSRIGIPQKEKKNENIKILFDEVSRVIENTGNYRTEVKKNNLIEIRINKLKRLHELQEENRKLSKIVQENNKKISEVSKKIFLEEK